VPSNVHKYLPAEIQVNRCINTRVNRGGDTNMVFRVTKYPGKMVLPVNRSVHCAFLIRRGRPASIDISLAAVHSLFKIFEF